VLVALTIARCGIVFRLILGTLSICLCILIEGVAFQEAVLAREVGGEVLIRAARLIMTMVNADEDNDDEVY
jgi:hypothetical protein